MNPIEYDNHEFQTPNGRPLPFKLRRGSNDYNVIASLSLFDEYGLRGLTFLDWALDLGAHIGGVGICLAVDNPLLRVFCVEPVPENAQLIRDNAALNNVGDRVTVLENAIGAPGTRTKVRYGFRSGEDYDHHAWVGNASMVYEDAPVEAHTEIEVACLDLAHIFRFEPNPPQVIKLDAEGGEWDALNQIIALRPRRVVGEWHPVCGRSSSKELVDAFESAEYTVALTGPEAGPGGFTATR
jgi:FkbM family methyltransferase